ncbi:MAG TPA: putative Ig domain-containing protein [Terracidiphilus sp.]|nr:putative Ig domain-containing protein [Terracidiphilus sp.]
MNRETKRRATALTGLPGNEGYLSPEITSSSGANRNGTHGRLWGASALGAIVLAGLAVAFIWHRAEGHTAVRLLVGTVAPVAPVSERNSSSAPEHRAVHTLTRLKAHSQPADLDHRPASSASTPSSPAVRVRAMQIYAALPLSFEANNGQTDPRVKFLAHGPGYTLFLTPREAVLSLPDSSKLKTHTGARLPLPQSAADGLDKPQLSGTAHAVRIKFVNAGTPSAIAGRDPLPGKTNYFIGNDPKQWHTNVPNYSAVEYRNLYPGVDAVFHGDNQRLEFDFDIAPGANPQAIALEVDGARHLRLNRAGDLELGLDQSRAMVMGKPHIYQQTPEGRREIAGHYVLGAHDRIAFALDPYDRAQPLVIDPTLAYSSYLGGSLEDLPYAIAADSSGSAYIVGQAYSPNFPVTPGAYQTSCTETGKTTCTPGMAFVTKLSPDGSSLVYSTFLNGRTNADEATGIAVDSSNSAYIVGAEAGETDFPTTTGAIQPVCSGAGNTEQQIFVAKLDPTGSTLDYSTCLQDSVPSASNYFSSGSTSPGGIAVDADGDAYVTGQTDVPESFPTTQGTIETACVPVGSTGCNVSADPFVVKINSTGTSLIYSTFLSGGASGSVAYTTGIAVDSLGNAYVIGDDFSYGYPAGSPGGLLTTRGSLVPTCTNFGCGGFLAKINGDATALVYSTYLANLSLSATPTAVAVNQNGEAYVSGFTEATDFPTTVGALQFYFTPPGAPTQNLTDGFVVEMDPSGDAYEYATYIGGTAYNTEATGVAIDAAGHAFVTGVTDSGFPTTADAFQTTDGAGDNQAFLAELDPEGATLLYSTYLAGTNGEAYDTLPSTTGVSYIATDPNGAAYVIGQTDSSTFPTSGGAFQSHTPLPSGSTGVTGFVAKFSFSQTVTLAISPSTVPSGTAGAAYSQTLMATGATGTVTFAVTAGSLPAGITLASDGALSGTPTQTGTFPFTVTATDANNDTGTQTYSLVIACQAITVEPTSLDPGTSGTTYPAVTFTENGGVGATSFSESGALPTGITFASAVLSGTPTQTGSFPFEVTATDSNSCTGSVSDTLTINAATLPPASVSYNETVTVTDTETFPDVADSEKVTVVDGYSVRVYTPISITPSPAAFNTNNGTGYATYAYAQVPFSATGGAGTLTLTESGALPAGITFTNGALSGTPASSAAGTYTFSVTATDSFGDSATLQGYALTILAASAFPAVVTDSETITVTDTETFPDVADAEQITVTDSEVVRAYTPISITPSPASFNTNNGTGYATHAYAQVPFSATGGAGTLTLTESGALPAGITFTNGALSGTPGSSAAGAYTFSVTATDAFGDSATLQGYTLTILAASAFPAVVTDNESITVTDTETFPDVADAEQITVTDTETVIAFNAIAITPSAATFNSSDGAGIAGGIYGPVTFVASGGTGTLTLTENGTLPAGLTFKNGALGGTLGSLSFGTYTFSVTATDAKGDQATQQGYTLTIAPPQITSLKISANPDALTIAQGMTGTTKLTFTPSGGYSGKLALSCSGLPANSLCVFTEEGVLVDSVTLVGDNLPMNVQLTFVTDASLLQARLETNSTPKQNREIMSAVAFWWSGSLVGLAAFVRKRNMFAKSQQWFRLTLLLLLASTLAAGLTGCILRGVGVTPVGTSKVTVTATPGSGPAQTLSINITITK